MKSIGDAATELTAVQRPVLCLDTCVLLDVVRAAHRAQLDLMDVVHRLSQTIATTPDRLQVVVTSLVLREWAQGVEEVQQEASRWLAATDERISDIHRAWERIGKPLANAAPVYGGAGLVEELTDLAKALINAAMVLKEDGDCVARAVHRVKWKKRPSHKREIKDSIHLEHYLRLSHALQIGGHARPRVLVSTNSSDFWENANTPARAHPDLIPDLASAGLAF